MHDSSTTSSPAKSDPATSDPAKSDPAKSDPAAIDLTIAGIQEPVIYSYFFRLNQGDFQGVADLFAPEGCLHAPFESGICGRTAIAQYLQTEAQGMTALPRSGSLETAVATSLETAVATSAETITETNVKMNVKTSKQTIAETKTETSDRYVLTGVVKTSFFTVNAGWTIELNPDKQITSVTVKLLAGLQELLNLQRR